MLLSILGASLLANIFIGKGVIVMRNSRGIYRAGEWIVMVMKTKKVKNKKKETRLWNQNGFLMPPYPLTNFEIQKYYQNEPRFNGVYTRDNLQKGLSIYNKFWWVLWYWNSLGCFACTK